MSTLTPRAQEMLALLRRHAAGEPLSRLAAEAGVAPATMTWWRHRLRDVLARRPVEFVELSVEVEEGGVEDPDRTPQAITVTFAEFRIELAPGFAGSELARLVGVLRRC